MWEKYFFASFYIFGYLLQLRIEYDRFKELIINSFSIWQIFALKNPGWYLLVETKEGDMGGAALSASPAVLSMWPAKIFFTSKFSYVLFCNSTNKTETGTANRWGSNHLDQSLWWANQKHWAAVRSQLLYSFSAGAQRCCCALYQPRQPNPIMLSQNYFPESNRHMLNVIHPIVPCRITYWSPLEML